MKVVTKAPVADRAARDAEYAVAYVRLANERSLTGMDPKLAYSLGQLEGYALAKREGVGG